MAQTCNLDVGSLWLLHWPKSAGSPDPGLRDGMARAGLFLDTCLRQLVLGLAPRPAAGDGVLATGGELFAGAEAYRFALEITTGLRSAVPGETNVFGQFRRAWREFAGQLRRGDADRFAKLIELLMEDTRNIRREHLEGIGGASYGSLVRRLLAARPDERVLIIGSGNLAQSILPFLRSFDVGYWNHRPADPVGRGLSNGGRWFEPCEADLAGRWADHVVFTTPADDGHDQAWMERLAAGRVRSLIHLGRRRHQRLPWRVEVAAFDLDDLFELAEEQAGLRSRQLELARLSCARRAGERAGAPGPRPAPTLRLGTRGSPLALAQSRRVAEALQAAHPQLAVELVPAVTRGDRNLAVALSAVADPDFFSAELDDALLAGEVDFCVHSLKDLGARRPAGIVRAALPVRENPRDVIVFRGDVQDRLRAGRALRIGTSSGRRQLNVAGFLPGALPDLGKEPALRFESLRGAVGQRLARIHVPGSDAEALDGVVLALAGLARLWQDPAGRRELMPLLSGVRWMVLPLSTCPAAAGQGVLAVECRAGDDATLRLLRAIHDPITESLYDSEQEALARLPPRAQEGVGATAAAHATLGTVCYLRGHTGPVGGAVLERVVWQPPPSPAAALPFDGSEWQRLCQRQALPAVLELPSHRAVFVAHWHALEHADLPAAARIWTSGVESWRRLAARGLWVEGCGDNLGFENILPTLGSAVLALPSLANWTVLTHASAVTGWTGSGVGTVVPTYRIVPPPAGPELDDLRARAARASHFYWSSPEQFAGLRDVLPAGGHHSCGAGKTLQVLRTFGTVAEPFPNGREWRRWLR